jgi:alginate O-acetyltransferase complex protein AlgI
MLFNSLSFLCFFLVVFGLYSILRRWRLPRNLLLLIASYYFYGSWNFNYLWLLAFCTVSSWGSTLLIDRATRSRQRLIFMWAGVGVNLVVLAVFKYLGLFSQIVSQITGALGGERFDALQIILPVGISFYTFQAISHIVDVYRRSDSHHPSLFDFALFVSFFPQLVAGPIERAGHIIPQLRTLKPFNWGDLEFGFFLIVWGLFKKLVIADNLATVANSVFGSPKESAGFSIFLGVVAFAFQIYCDFSGYTDIARGLGKFFGIDLSLNFRLPYFARDPSDFWERWHISLSTWIRDYLYIPLGGSRGTRTRTLFNLFFTMALAGLWHGAAYTFILWGLYHGMLLSLYHVVRKPVEALTATHRVFVSVRIFGMFVLVLNGWLYFRAESPSQIVEMYSRMGLAFGEGTGSQLLTIAFLTLPLLGIQWYQQRSRNLIWINGLNLFGRSFAITVMILLIALFGLHAPTEFIYFQF